MGTMIPRWLAGTWKRASVALLLVGPVFLVGCLPEGGPKLAVFQPGAGACSADPARVQVQAEAGGLTVSGAFLAPTPCHSLRAVLGHPSQGELVLTITAAPSEEMCVQCLALIPYEGRIEGLAHGRWHLRVYHGAELLWDAWHEVTPP